jgi:hypothetical protein
VCETADDQGGRRYHRRSMYGITADQKLYMFMLECIGPPDRMKDCDGALSSMQLAISNPAEIVERSVGYKIGQVIGILILVAIPTVIVLWLSGRGRRTRRRMR